MYKGIVFIFVFFWSLAFIIGRCSETSNSSSDVELPALPNKESTSSLSQTDELLPSEVAKPQQAPRKRMDLRDLVHQSQAVTVESQRETAKEVSQENKTTQAKEREVPQKASTVVTIQKENLEIPRSIDYVDEQILRRLAYTVSYNRTTKCPNWVAWHLTREHLKKHWSRDGIPYFEDTEAVEPRQELQDWRINPKRYDHGHMCPAADNRWSKKAMVQSFYLTNICPQHRDLNRDEWADLEEECRHWAAKYGEVFIVCGPIYYNGKNQTIGGRKEIWVPDAFFKVVLALKDSPKAIGFIYPNEYTQGSLSHFVHSVDEVEKLTSFDFFSLLPDEIENVIEAQAHLTDW